MQETLGAWRFPVCLETRRRIAGCDYVTGIGGRIVDDADGNFVTCSLPQGFSDDCSRLVAETEIVNGNVERSAGLADETGDPSGNPTDLRRTFRR